MTNGATTAQLEQSAYRLLFHYRIAKRQFGIDSIPIAASAAAAIHVPRLFQIAQHVVRIALGDVRSFCNLLDPQIRVCCNSKKDLSVMGDERPSSGELLEMTRLPRFHAVFTAFVRKA